MNELMTTAITMLGAPDMIKRKLAWWTCGCVHKTNLKRKLTKFTPCHEHIHQWKLINNIKPDKADYHVN